VNLERVCLHLGDLLEISSLLRLIKAFLVRLSKGEFVSAAYLTYHYCYIGLYDYKHRTQFMNSQKPQKGHESLFATGNFPCSPKVVRKLIKRASINPEDNILDVGCGSGLFLHVLYQEGYKNLHGIELSKNAYLIAKSNLNGIASIIEGNALSLDLTVFDGIFFFRPFSNPAQNIFLSSLPPNIRFVITMNEDLGAEKVLRSKGFINVFSYTHRYHENYSGKVYSS
jgi:SAM-dependent methyltransferase